MRNINEDDAAELCNITVVPPTHGVSRTVSGFLDTEATFFRPSCISLQGIHFLECREF